MKLKKSLGLCLVLALSFTMVFAKKSAVTVKKGEARIGSGDINVEVANTGCSQVFYDPDTNSVEYSCDAKTEPAAKTKMMQMQQFYKNSKIKLNKGKTTLALKAAFLQPDPQKEVYYSLNGTQKEKNKGATVILKREKSIVSITIYIISDEELVKPFLQ